MRTPWCVLALTLSGTAAAGIPSGEVIEDALTVDLTEEAFDLAEEMALGFVPPEILIPEVSDFPGGFCLFTYGLRVRDLAAGIEVLDIDIRPDNGALVAEPKVICMLCVG